MHSVEQKTSSVEHHDAMAYLRHSFEKLKEEVAAFSKHAGNATIRPLINSIESFETTISNMGSSRNNGTKHISDTSTHTTHINGVSNGHAQPDQTHETTNGTKPLIKQAEPPKDTPKKLPVLECWDHGIFFNELQKYKVYEGSKNPKIPVKGTYDGTKRSLAQMFERIEHTFDAMFNISGHEPTIPWPLSDDTDLNYEELKKQRLELWTYQKPGDDKNTPYPPHLRCIPPGGTTPQVGFPGAIFDTAGFLNTSTLLAPMIPDVIIDFFHDFKRGQNTFADIEKSFRTSDGSGFVRRNSVRTIAEKDDWYCDDWFAQQAFTGTNPTTICKASEDQVNMFKAAATQQGNDAVLKILKTETDNFFILDCSYFREAVGLGPEVLLSCTDQFYTPTTDPTSKAELFLPATVTLFHLGDEGRLHPQAIIIDFKSSVEKSVTIFNQRLNISSSKETEATDWPWRYAKMCAQVSDWVRHELTVHLTQTHLVEEAIIVAANRAFDPTHPVFKLLRPHWMKTLSLNAAARSALVPSIIEKLVGVPGPQVYEFINHAYRNFDFEKQYVPTDLRSRGFDPAHMHPGSGRFRNYGYGYNIHLMWSAIRRFVTGKLASQGMSSDADVTSPKLGAQIRDWCAEMQSPTGGQMPSFPTITTLAALVDAVTMCIHIASPQHTAVNYLQEYYQSFILNKPPALCAPLPQSLAQLSAYTEQDLVAALPVHRPKSWLLASHIPHLLSAHVVSHDSLLTFALSYREFADQHVRECDQHIEDARAAGDGEGVARREAERRDEVVLRDAAEGFLRDLDDMSEKSMLFERGFTFNEGCDAKGLRLVYKVLQPSAVAGSIEI